MYKKISARRSAAISTAQEERKYVLEDVFWVPECNSKARHHNLAAPPEHCSKDPGYAQNFKQGEDGLRAWGRRIIE